MLCVVLGCRVVVWCVTVYDVVSCVVMFRCVVLRCDVLCGAVEHGVVLCCVCDVVLFCVSRRVVL